MSHQKARRGIAAGIGMAVGAFLAAGLVPLATSAVARADDDGAPGTDNDFMVGPLQNFGIFTDQSFADPDDNEYLGMIIQGPMSNGDPLFTEVVTSGTDPSDSLASFFAGSGVPADTGIGTANETIFTLVDPSDPALDSTFTIPFSDPFAEIFTALLPLGF
jgi:hypothetical protein